MRPENKEKYAYKSLQKETSMVSLWDGDNIGSNKQGKIILETYGLFGEGSENRIRAAQNRN